MPRWLRSLTSLITQLDLFNRLIYPAVKVLKIKRGYLRRLHPEPLR